MRATIRAGLAGQLDPRLVDELLDAHEEAKRNFYLGGLRLNAVEGGRFCEAAFRLLEQISTGRFTPLGKKLNTEGLIQRLGSLPTTVSDSVRLHIPRALRVVYDIRNKRDAAHLADSIDPNLQDATLVVGIIDWVLAEFVRLYHRNISADEAQRIVEALVTRLAPAVQDFDGFLKVLNPKLSASDYCLVLLYQRGPQGATYDQMESWVKPAMRHNLSVTLSRLTHNKAFVHADAGSFRITRTGQQEVERRNLVQVGD